MIYLASPYTHADKRVMETRYRQTLGVTGRLIQAGLVVFSPIVNSHHLAEAVGHDWKTWTAFDKAMIDLADAVLVLKLDGWDRSIGVTAEIEYAEEQGVEVVYMDPDGPTPAIEATTTTLNLVELPVYCVHGYKGAKAITETVERKDAQIAAQVMLGLARRLKGLPGARLKLDMISVLADLTPDEVIEAANKPTTTKE